MLRYGVCAALFVVACGGGDRAPSGAPRDGGARLDTASASDERGAEAAAPGSADIRDPVRLKVIADLGGTAATYEGMGECHHTADASIYEVPATMWSAHAADEAGALRYLNLTLWQPKGTSELQVSLGLAVGATSRDLATVKGAPIKAPATATATSRGRGRVVSGGGHGCRRRTKVRVTVECERWTEPVAEGG